MTEIKLENTNKNRNNKCCFYVSIQNHDCILYIYDAIIIYSPSRIHPLTAETGGFVILSIVTDFDCYFKNINFIVFKRDFILC